MVVVVVVVVVVAVVLVVVVVVVASDRVEAGYSPHVWTASKVSRPSATWRRPRGPPEDLPPARHPTAVWLWQR